MVLLYFSSLPVRLQGKKQSACRCILMVWPKHLWEYSKNLQVVFQRRPTGIALDGGGSRREATAGVRGLQPLIGKMGRTLIKTKPTNV